MSKINSEWETGGIQTVSYSDNDGHDLVIQRIQDVSPILDYNKFLRSQWPSPLQGRKWRYVALCAYPDYRHGAIDKEVWGRCCLR